MLDEVKKYYGQTLESSADLQTSACCTIGSPPDHLKAVLAKIHPEVASRYYGCGLLAPELLDGLRILDLGSGSGRDAYALSALVGASGSVVGVDMTDEQLAVANQFIDFHTDAYGYTEANVEFLKGYIEKLDEIGLEDGQFDVIVSNCVINLSEDKNAVLEQACRLLKPGGEMYFSDVYSDRRVPAALTKDPVLYGECLSGALYWNDFINLAKRNGFTDPRLVTDRPLAIGSSEIEKKIGHINFYSATYRLFKLDGLEPACEDYGQAVIYKGTIAEHPMRFDLDKHHSIEAGKVFPVCGNTYRMLCESRFAPHFEFIGSFDTHYGIFDGCGDHVPFSQTADSSDDTASVGSSVAGGSCC
jgi:SAM-dependent methyltransferase